MLNYFDKFLAVDLHVLNILNVTYPKYKYKFLPLTMKFNIIDPYQLEADEYIKTMNDINYVVTGASAENWSGSTDSHNDHAGFGLRRKLFTTSMFEFETRGQWSNTDHEMVCVATFR